MSNKGQGDNAQGPHWLDRRDNRSRTHFGRRRSGREQALEELLGAWYGPDRGRLEVLARQGPARSIGEVVPSVLGLFGLRDGLELTELLERWPDLVGQDIARRAEPVAYRRGTVLVEVCDSSWLFALENMHKQSILTAVQSVLPRSVGLRFVPAGRRRRGPSGYGRRGTPA